jgi:release factor glutamine methyltransferase
LSRNIRELLAEARKLLPSGPYENPVLDSLLLLGNVMGLSKEQLYARLHDEIDDVLTADFLELIDRRRGGEATAYILGKREFYGLEFSVDSRVLIPRPDTETLVEWVLESHGASRLNLHDCCSGSGAIAIACADSRPDWVISASDISYEAGAVFELNWRRLIDPSASDPVPWHRSDLLTALPAESQDIITANPPYLTRAECEKKEAEGWPEPRLALDGGEKGLDLIRTLVSQAMGALRPGGFIYIEAADWQADTICSMLETSGFSDIGVKTDIEGRKRISRGRKGFGRDTG